MSRPDWCPEETWEKAQQLAEHVIDKHEACGCDDCMDEMLEHFARALIDAHQHGRREGMEEAAETVQAYLYEHKFVRDQFAKLIRAKINEAPE